MSNSVMAAGAPPARKSLPARVVGVITAPRAAFESIAAHPRWFGALALTIVVVALCQALPLTTEEGKQAALEAQVSQMESFGRPVSDEQYVAMEKRIAFAPYVAAGGVVVVSPVMALIVAAILFAVFNAAMGGDATFKQLFAVLVHAGVISSLQQLFTGPLNYVRGSVASATNLLVLLPMIDSESFFGSLLATIDIFLVWYVVVLAIGLAVLYRRRTRPIAIGLFAVYAVIALTIATVKTNLGS
jgi:hypothetical protein